MNRRNFTKLGIVGGATAFAAKKIAAAPNANQPNLLIIKTDEHSFRTLGCYRNLLTPDQAYMWGEGVGENHLDRIADEGAICTSYYSACPVCTPARASLLQVFILLILARQEMICRCLIAWHGQFSKTWLRNRIRRKVASRWRCKTWL